MRRILITVAVVWTVTTSTSSAPTSRRTDASRSAGTLQSSGEASGSASPDSAGARQDDKGKRKMMTDADLQASSRRISPRLNAGIRIGSPRRTLAGSKSNDLDQGPDVSISTSHIQRDQSSPSTSQAAKKKGAGRGYFAFSKWDDRSFKRGTKAKIEKANREAFERVWNEHNLHLDMDPVALADQVMTITTKGDSKEATPNRALAARIVKSKRDADYESKYLLRTARLSKYMSVKRKEVANDSYYKSMKLDEKQQRKIALEEVFKAAAKFDNRQKRIVSSPPLPTRKNALVAFRRVGEAVKQLLKEKKEDFQTIPLDKLIQHTQGLGAKLQMTPKHFTQTLYRYLRHERGDSQEALSAITRAQKHVTSKRA